MNSKQFFKCIILINNWFTIKILVFHHLPNVCILVSNWKSNLPKLQVLSKTHFVKNHVSATRFANCTKQQKFPYKKKEFCGNAICFLFLMVIVWSSVSHKFGAIIDYKPARYGRPMFFMFFYPAKSGILQSPSCVCLFVCLFVSRISHKLLVGFWWNLVSREVMIIGRPSSKLGVIRIEIRIWDPDNCFSWTTGRILDQDFNQIQDNSNLIIVIW